MKKGLLFSVSLIIPLFCSGCFFNKMKGTGTEEDPYIVTKTDDIKKMVKNSEDTENFYYYRLDEDILYSGEMLGAFRGNFDMNSHTITITNLSSLKFGYYPDNRVGFFSELKVNSVIKNGTVEWKLNQDANAGQNANMTLFCGFVGICHGRMEFMTSSGSIKINPLGLGSVAVGGLAASAYSYSEFVYCSNYASISTTSNYGAWVGGLVGFCAGSEKTDLNVLFDTCTNSGTLEANAGKILTTTYDYAGGMIGNTIEPAGNKFVACTNTGKLKVSSGFNSGTGDMYGGCKDLEVI